MSFFALIHGIPGIRRATFRDAEGGLIEGLGRLTTESEDFSALATAIALQLSQIGRLLSRGACELIVLRTQASATALVLRRGALAILQCDNKCLSLEVEKKLRTTEWTATDAVISNPMGVASSSEISAAVTDGLLSSGNASVEDDGPVEPLPLPSPLPPMPAAPSAELAAAVSDELTRPTPSAAHRMKGLKITASATAVGGDDTMFAGSLRMVCLPDLLEFCRHGQRTGMLFCHLGASTGSMTLRRGKIIEAESPATAKATLLTRLIESGDASQEQAKQLDLGSDDSSDDETVGRLLVEAGFTHQEAVRKAMLDQIKESVEEMMGWIEGTFAFHPMDEDTSVSQDCAVDSEMILLQVFKERDELGRDEESD